MRPLNGTHTHPLTAHALGVLRRLASADLPALEVNPGTANRLEREHLVERVLSPSPYKAHRGGTCEHLRITADGRARI